MTIVLQLVYSAIKFLSGHKPGLSGHKLGLSGHKVHSSHK